MIAINRYQVNDYYEWTMLDSNIYDYYIFIMSYCYVSAIIIINILI
jgi:hypothetical protein